MLFKKKKVIIDTDPGVDDTTCLLFALFDKKLDIKLFTITPGNIATDIGARNLCHILDIFGKDYPVAKGPKTAMKRVSEDAAWLHGKEGLGGYIPPKTAKHKPLKESAADAMYKVIKQNPHEITIVALGPHTNIGNLLTKYPDSADLIKAIVFEGAAPFGLPYNKDYISFNARTDPEALKIVMDSKIPVIMIPSPMGRTVTHLTEDDVNRIKNENDAGKFLAKTFEIYWEPGVDDRRIATNDTCALFYLEKPSMYMTKRCNVKINVTDKPGDMDVEYKKDGHVKIVLDIDRKKFLKIFFSKMKTLDSYKIDDKIYKLSEKVEK